MGRQLVLDTETVSHGFKFQLHHTVTTQLWVIPLTTLCNDALRSPNNLTTETLFLELASVGVSVPGQ